MFAFLNILRQMGLELLSADFRGDKFWIIQEKNNPKKNFIVFTDCFSLDFHLYMQLNHLEHTCIHTLSTGVVGFADYPSVEGQDTPSTRLPSDRGLSLLMSEDGIQVAV